MWLSSLSLFCSVCIQVVFRYLSSLTQVLMDASTILPGEASWGRTGARPCQAPSP